MGVPRFADWCDSGPSVPFNDSFSGSGIAGGAGDVQFYDSAAPYEPGGALGYYAETYTIDFGDGGTAGADTETIDTPAGNVPSAAVSHTYPRAGAYLATLSRPAYFRVHHAERRAA
jgi:hypothetical protein